TRCYRDWSSDVCSSDLPALLPVELPTAKRWPHVVRGGSFVEPAGKLRSAARRASHRDWLRRDPERPPSIWWLTDADFVGFRVVQIGRASCRESAWVRRG